MFRERRRGSSVHFAKAACSGAAFSFVFVSRYMELTELNHHIPLSMPLLNKVTGAPDCASARCGMDAGCRREQDGSWICICPHDLSLPRPDGSCPRIVVTQNPFQRANTKKTFITIRGSRGDHSSNLTLPVESKTGEHQSALFKWVFPVAGFIVLAVAVGAAILFWRRRRFKNVLPSLPVPLFRDVLDGDRFTANPAYEHCTMTIRDPAYNNSCDPEEIILLREWITLEEEIGQGHFGKVYRGHYRRPGPFNSLPLCDETVAVKVLKANAGREAEQEVFREARVMAEFSHPNILAVHGVVLNEGKIGPWLVFEYMSLGDLAQLLRMSGSGIRLQSSSSSPREAITLTQMDMLSMAEQVAAGMLYLSSLRFVHRDLACRNCLAGQIDQGSGDLVVKISDFGMSRDVYTTDYYKMGGSQMLPVRWMSPESILYGKFTTESDIWSYGVLLWEIFSEGVQPYYGHSNEEVIKLILEGILLKTPESSPPLIRHLLHDCWKLQPADRITFGCIHSQLLAERRQPRRSAYSQKKNFKTGSSYITVSDVIEVLETDEDTKSTSQVCVLKE